MSYIPRFKSAEITCYSPTGLEMLIECPRRRFLQKKVKKKLTWPELAKGTHLHRKIEQLRLHHLRKEMGKNPRYKTAEAFGNVIANDWSRGPVKEGKIRGDVILWNKEDKGQPYRMKEEIREIGNRIYPILTEEENKPFIFTKISKKGNVSYHTAYEFEFTYRGRGFKGEIDEIRKEGENFVLRDYKSGKWRYIENELEYAIQPTEYILAFSFLALRDENFRKTIGITEEEAEFKIKDPELNSKYVGFEYFMLDIPKEWDNEKKEFVVVDKKPVIRINRENRHYKELCLKINAANAWNSDMQDRNYYYPLKGTHCKRCFYEEECNKMTNSTEVHLLQCLLSDYIGVNKRPKNYVVVELLPLKPEVQQVQFDFMNEIKKQRKPVFE